MDRIGRLITRWVRGDDGQNQRNAILGTVIPVIPPSAENYIAEQSRRHAASHASLTKQISAALYESASHIPKDIVIFPVPDFPSQRPLLDKRLLADLRKRSEAVITKLPEYEAETLQVFYDRLAGTNHLLRVLEEPLENEIETRDQFHFSTIDKNQNLSIPKVMYFEPLREHFDVNSLSEFPVGSPHYTAVRMALDIISVDIYQRSLRNATKKSPIIGYIPSYGDMVREKWADPDSAVWLTELAMLHPDRKDDILWYLKDRELDLDDVDVEYLREYLDNPAPALSEGVL